MKKPVVLGGVLIVLVGISVYLWTTKADTETDTTVAQTKEKFKCPHCEKEFELTNAESTRMYQSGTGIICPFCKESGSSKTNIEFTIGGFGGGDDGTSEEEEVEEEGPATAKGGLQPKRRP